MAKGKLEAINPPGLYDPSSFYTHAMVVPPGARMAYIAGQYAGDETGSVISNDFATQVKKAFDNLRIALEAAGARPEHVVKITVLIVNYTEERLGPLQVESDALWGARKPSSTLIPVPRLAFDDMLFEIDAVAAIPAS